MNTLYYDYDPDGSKRPVWLTIPFDHEQQTDEYVPFYVDAQDYEAEYVGELNDDWIGCSVQLEELVVGKKQNEFGIKLHKIIDRVGDLSGIDRFIIQVSDIVEVMAYSKTLD